MFIYILHITPTYNMSHRPHLYIVISIDFSHSQFSLKTVFIFIEKKFIRITPCTQYVKIRDKTWNDIRYRYVIDTLLKHRWTCYNYINVYIISFWLGKYGDSREMYEGNSIFHSKDVEKTNEALKILIKEDGRRIILCVNYIYTLSQRKTIFFLCLKCFYSGIQYQIQMLYILIYYIGTYILLNWSVNPWIYYYIIVIHFWTNDKVLTIFENYCECILLYQIKLTTTM